MTTQPPDWDAVYVASTPPPWDIGRPQAAFVRLARGGMLCGRVLDAGCGTGEHVLLAAARGADAMGVDVSRCAIEQARGKAAARDVTGTGLAGRYPPAVTPSNLDTPSPAAGAMRRRRHLRTGSACPERQMRAAGGS